MSNKEHLKLNHKGSEAWNAWRRANPDAFPDFSEAILVGVYLRGIDLSRANLSNADFCVANLSWGEPLH